MSMEMMMQWMMMTRQEEKELRQEELRLQREKEEKAENVRLAELELQKHQFDIQLEQLKSDREDAERRRLEQMIEFERARKSDEEIRQQQVDEKRLREEEKEKV